MAIHPGLAWQDLNEIQFCPLWNECECKQDVVLGYLSLQQPTQLYLSFKPHSDASQTASINAMECCIEKIREWMIRDKWMINDSKTEFILIGTRQQLCKLQPCAISVGDDTITSSTQVKNLGCWLDSHLNMSKQVTSVCKSAFYHLHNIRRIKNYLSRENLLTLVHAFITSIYHIFIQKSVRR